jgi:AAA family ATP:ADP antiporter
MTSLRTRLAGKLVTLREGEAATAALMFAYSFLAMTSYNMLKPITRSKFISALGADNLPYVQLVAGVLIGVLMQLYSQAIGRLPRRWVIPVTQAGEVALLVLFWFLFRTGADWVSAAFYVLGLVLGILLISQFWTLANDIYDPRQAKRLFGFIGGGASLGGAMGAALTAVAVEEVGTNNLLLVSAAILGVCVALVTTIVRRQQVTSDFTSVVDERGVGGGEAIRLLRSSRHLQVIALVIGFAAIGASIIDQQLNMAAESVKGAEATDAITGFLAQVTFYLSIAGFVVQVGLTSRIHRSLGLAFALLILPASLGTTAVIILLNGALWAPAAARVLDTSLRYTIDKTTREVLFLPLPADLKYRAKPFVDVTMDRFAKALGALLILVLIKPWGLRLAWQHLSYASLGVTGLWIFMAMRARGEYLKTFRRSIETRAIVPASVRLDVADAATIETLVEELSNPDESCVLYAIEMLEALDKRNLITPLLLHHESASVRARALLALESARPSVAGRWTPAVERMLQDEDAAVRAAAVHALATLRKEEAATLMRGHLRDPEPRVAMTAAVVLADSGREADAQAAEAAVRRLVEDTRDASAGARKEAAAALAQIRHPSFRRLLVPLCHDANLDVAREAIRSVRALGPVDPLLVPALVSLLGHRALKAEAGAALASYGDEMVDTLAYFLKDRDEQVWVRRHIPAVLALLPTQRSMNVLLDALDDPDGFLRYKVVAAMEKLRRDHPELVFARGPVEALVLKESSRYYNHLTLRYNIVQRDPQAQQSLLVRALEDKLERTLDRIYRLLGLIYPWKDIAAARYTIEYSDGRRRAGAIEYLDNLLGGAIRKLVMPIIEDSTMEEKVRCANLVLSSRPRDLEDTLAQLVHDSDPVVAASAIQFVEQRQLWSLSDDLEYVLAHPSVADGYVFEAASWALAAHRLADKRRDLWTEPLPAVELADRLRTIPLFDFVSVDELFRIAGMGRQVRHPGGRELYHEGAQADDVQFLLEGSVCLSGGDGTPCDLNAPAVLAFEKMLEGRPLRHTIRSLDRAICLTLGSDEFLTMLSDNIMLAQGLFRMLLDTPKARQWRTVYTPPPGAEPVTPRSWPLQPLDKVLLLRQNPLLGRATVTQLLDLATIPREVPLTAGGVLFTETDQPAVYHVLKGEVQLEAAAADPIVAGPGSTIGVSETLAGVPLGRRATVTREGQAVRLDHDDLFDVLADHIDLLQGLFSGLLQANQTEAAFGASP